MVTAPDSTDALKADLLAAEPEAVQAAVDAKAEEWLRAAVKFARSWQLSDDPWSGIAALNNALTVLTEAQKHLERNVSQSRRYFWRGSRNPADQAAAIWDALSCGRPRCACQQHKATHCPAHQDNSPSLSVTVKDGRLLLHCFAGCSQQAVIHALRERGLWSVPLGGVR